MMVRKFLFGAILAGIAMAGLAPPARAGFTLTLTNGSSTTSYTFGGAAVAGFTQSSSGGFESIGFNGTIGNYVLEISSTLSNSGTGSLPATISVNAQNAIVSGTGAQTLVITASDSGFTVPPAGLAAMTTGVSSTYIFQGSESVTDQSTLASTAGTLLTLNAGDSAVSPVTNLVTIPTSPYTLSNTLTINGTGGDGNIEGQGETSVNTVPVPASMILVLSGAPALGLGYWLRRRQVRLVAAV
jgi:hypothetical protein